MGVQTKWKEPLVAYADAMDEMCLYSDKLHSDIGLSDVCGKCLVNVPCSTTNPVKLNR